MTDRQSYLTITLVLSVVGLYVLTAAPTVFWLDSSELAAGAFELGVPHPPGHPLFVLLGKFATLIPIGTIAFRVHVLCALLTAAAIGLGVRFAVWLWGCEAWIPAMGVMAALALATPFWFHGVRAEVYPLNLLLALVIMALSALCATRGQPHHYLALGFVTGLALCNHHYLIAFMAPGVVWVLLVHSSSRSMALRKLPLCLGIWLIGLLPYVLVPIRSPDYPTVRWGQGDSLRGLVWTITARAFQKTTGRLTRVDAGAALTQLGSFLLQNLGPILLGLAVVGLFLIARRRANLAAGLVLLIAGNLTSQVLFDFDPDNPDVAGYFLLSLWTVALLAVGPLAALVRFVRTRHAITRWVGMAAALLLSISSALLFLPASFYRANLAGFRDPDHFARRIYETTPTGGLILTSYFETIFNLWYRDVAECQRPDVSVVHRLFRTYPGYDDYLRHRFPELTPMLDADAGRGELNTSWLLDQSTRRPILVELDPTLQREVRPYLLPMFLLTQVSPLRIPRKPIPKPLETLQRGMWDDFYRLIHPTQRETSGNLLWMHYHHAALLAGQGQWLAARAHLDRALALAPNDIDLLELEAALDRHPGLGPVWPKFKDESEGLAGRTGKKDGQNPRREKIHPSREIPVEL